MLSDDQLRQPLQAGAVGLQLGPHGLVVGDRVAFHRREVDEVDEHRAALDVGEELVAQPGALGGALDQPGDVGDDGLAVLAFDRPQHRRERRERVVGDLRRRPRQPPQQRGLAGVRQPDQPDVGEQLQPQLDPVRLALGPVLGEARRLPGRGREALVPVAAAAAVRDHRPLPRLDQVDRAAVDAVACVPAGTGITRSSPRAPCRLDPSPWLPRCAAEVLAPFQRPQIAPRGVADEHHVPPMPAVATVGPAPRHMRLTPKADAAVAAGPALNPDLRLVVQALRE